MGPLRYLAVLLLGMVPGFVVGSIAPGQSFWTYLLLNAATQGGLWCWTFSARKSEAHNHG